MKAKYVIINSEEKYFVKILRDNSILFTNVKEEATQIDWEETQDLIPIIELYDGHVCMAENI